MVLDASLLTTQHYNVRIKGKVEQSRERSSALSLHLGVVAIKNEAFGSLSTTITNCTYLLFVWIQNFPSPRPVALLELKNPVCHIFLLVTGHHAKLSSKLVSVSSFGAIASKSD